MSAYNELSQYVTRWSDDPAKADPELICYNCDELICDIEQGDTLDVLARTAISHECGWSAP